MTFDPLAPPPLLTADLPGIGGRIKQAPEDFEVEEIPAYEPSGSGEFLYLWIEKRAMGAEFFARQVARRLGIPSGEVGTAGMKDRHAITRQMVSVPAGVEERLGQLDGDGIQVLRVSRHTNKLKTGHLHGNRFKIRVRDIDANAEARIEPLLERLRNYGLPNYYGTQRFGREGETVRIGMALVRDEPTEIDGRRINARNPFLRKLALSAAQSALFNHYLGQRLRDGLFRKVLEGDVMAKWPFGGLFVARDPAVEQARFDARETVTAGPIFGRKTFPAAATAVQREAAILQDAGLSIANFRGFGKLVQGTRRHNVLYINDLDCQLQNGSLQLAFSLPSGSYATVVLAEIMKNDTAEREPNDAPE
ncbi:MAG: tRNA pseudouridine(13) synthase TruD [Gemmataceae bacterium]|nr:tRNA pseudouridine(13) synthase TruD [Gemmataceae bacterium]